MGVGASSIKGEILGADLYLTELFREDKAIKEGKAVCCVVAKIEYIFFSLN